MSYLREERRQTRHDELNRRVYESGAMWVMSEVESITRVGVGKNTTNTATGLTGS